MGPDTGEFHKVYTEYRPQIKRYLARLAGDDEAEDLVQEVFVKVSAALPGFKGESTLSTWLYRIATNTALDRLRNPSYRQHRHSAPLPEELADEHRPGLREAPLPADQQLVKEEMNSCIRDVINGLPPDYRAVIALSELKELKDGEVADILGISVGAVKIRLHRARARLKEELEGHCDFYRDSRNEFACEPKPAVIKFKDKK